MYCYKKMFLCIALAMSLTLTGFTNTKVNYSKLNVPQYKFTDDVVKDAYVIQYDDFKIAQPYKQSNKQVLTYKQVAEEFQKLPKTLTKNVNEIQLLDYNSFQDKYWSEAYGIKDFKSYAKGGEKQICFYANSQFDISTNNNFKIAMIHELGHILDETISDINNRYSNTTEWILIMGKDLDNKDGSYGLYCSEYAKKSASSIEDFAESVTQYVIDNEEFTKDYPNRSKKLNELGIL